MRLRTLKIKDKRLITGFLYLSGHELSAYNFANIYIWQGLFKIKWGIIRRNLCLFFQDKTGIFLYLPPLGDKIHPEAVSASFEIMDGFNRNQEISRVENAEEKYLPFFKSCGYSAREKFPDYIYLRSALTGLKGNRFKSQRASCNYFLKHNRFAYRPFRQKHKKDCLELYVGWAKLRGENNSDPVYHGMLEDSYKSLKVLLNNYKDLGASGRVVKIGSKIEGFSFGFKLNRDTFCILYEITNLRVKGLAQFIFRGFCQELNGYKYINAMDDSGLENLKKAKLSYHPVKLIPNYIITRGDA